MKNKTPILLSLALSVCLLFHSLSLSAQTRINTNIQNLLKNENIQSEPAPANNQEISEDVKPAQQVFSQEGVRQYPKLEEGKKNVCGNFDLISGAFKACKEAGSSNESCEKYIVSYLESHGDTVSTENMVAMKERINALIAKECPDAKTSCECIAQLKKSNTGFGICPLPNECEVSCEVSKDDIAKLTQYYADRQAGAEDPTLKDLALKICGEEDLMLSQDRHILNGDTSVLQQSIMTLQNDQKLEENTNKDSNASGLKINSNVKSLSSGIRNYFPSMPGLREIDPLCLCLKKHHCPVRQCQNLCALSSSELYIISKYEKDCKKDKNSTDCKAVQDRYAKICDGKSPTRCLNDAMCFTPEEKVCENGAPPSSPPPATSMKDSPPSTDVLDAKGVIQSNAVNDNLLEGASKCSMQPYSQAFSLFQVLGFFMSLLASSLWIAIVRYQKN